MQQRYNTYHSGQNLNCFLLARAGSNLWQTGSTLRYLFVCPNNKVLSHKNVLSNPDRRYVMNCLTHGKVWKSSENRSLDSASGNATKDFQS